MLREISVSVLVAVWVWSRREGGVETNLGQCC